MSPLLHWIEIKSLLGDATGLSRDAMHIVAGGGAYLLLALLLRRSLGSAVVWALIMAVALANEGVDLVHEVWPDWRRQWSESLKDIVTTMLVPTFLLLLSRHAPAWLLTAEAAPPSANPTDDPQAIQHNPASEVE